MNNVHLVTLDLALAHARAAAIDAIANNRAVTGRVGLETRAKTLLAAIQSPTVDERTINDMRLVVANMGGETTWLHVASMVAMGERYVVVDGVLCHQIGGAP